MMKTQSLILLTFCCHFCSFVCASKEEYGSEFNRSITERNNKRFNIHTTFDPNLAPKSVEYSSEEQEEQLKKLCQNEMENFTFTLPNSKSLTFYYFTLPVHTLPSSPSLSLWKLTHVNEEKVYLTNIAFTIYPKKHSLYLNALYPGYPDVSGVDIMQFTMTLCHICKYRFETFDDSDLSTPYMFLHNQNYYESVINGKNKIVAKNNQPIDKDQFLICLRILIENEIGILSGSCETKVIQCSECTSEETNLRPENCPVTRPWLGRFLHKTVFNKCLYAPLSFASIPKHMIFTKNLNDILNKTFVKKQNSYKVELKVKNYREMLKGCERDRLAFNLMNSFEICIKDTLLQEENLTPFNIWKSTFPCVTDNVSYFLKFYSRNDIF